MCQWTHFNTCICNLNLETLFFLLFFLHVSSLFCLLYSKIAHLAYIFSTLYIAQTLTFHVFIIKVVHQNKNGLMNHYWKCMFLILLPLHRIVSLLLRLDLNSSSFAHCWYNLIIAWVNSGMMVWHKIRKPSLYFCLKISTLLALSWFS